MFLTALIYSELCLVLWGKIIITDTHGELSGIQNSSVKDRILTPSLFEMRTKRKIAGWTYPVPVDTHPINAICFSHIHTLYSSYYLKYFICMPGNRRPDQLPEYLYIGTFSN